MTIAIGLVAVLLIAAVAFLRLRGGESEFAAPTSNAAPPANGGLIQPHNISVIAKGWTKSELETILRDFSSTYGLETGYFEVQAMPDGLFRVAFQHGSFEPNLLFLVNYLNYPNGFDLKAHHLAVAGIIRLDPAMSLPADAKVGQRAVIYMPQDDQDYDCAYIRIEGGSAYRVNFSDMQWTPVSDARMPAEIAELDRLNVN